MYLFNLTLLGGKLPGFVVEFAVILEGVLYVL